MVEVYGASDGPAACREVDRRDDKARAWVAEVDGAIAGLLVLEAHDDHLLVENVAVEPSRQHQGIGRALLAFAEQRAAQLGLGELRLYTHVKMTENRALYVRLGYREVDRRSEEGRARVFMSKQLGE